MTTAKEICLAIVKYFIDFGNERFILLVPSPQINLLKSFFLTILTFPSTETMSTGLEIMKRTLTFKELRKVFTFDKIYFWALRGYLT